MKDIDLKNGAFFSGISALLLLSEILLYFILGFSAQAASGSGVRLFFDGFFLVIIITAVFGIFSLIAGVLNKWYKINIGLILLTTISVIISAAIFYCL